ncbi:MAG: ABC transporter ATP-binding protein [Candidatus Eiseniibacteriota bacterium]
MATPAVELEGITKSFGRLRANDGVSLTVLPGTIHALVGENGAGKTTLMKTLFGLYHPDAGVIRLNGEAVRFHSPADALARGLGMVHQHFMLVRPLTVAENITLAHEITTGPLLDPRRAVTVVRELSQRYGLRVDPEARIENLSVGEEQRVEILKALYHGAKILILDEPTAVLTPQETEELFGVLRSLRSQGTTVVLITHKLREVMAISDDVTVMRGGRTVGTRKTAATSIPELAELMVGRPVLLEVEKAEAKPGAPVLEIDGLSVRDDRGLPAVSELSLAVAAGEIVGIAGVEGNGQNELVEALTGLRRWTAGDVRLSGRSLHGLSPRAIAHLGVSHVPADRWKRGLVLEYSLEDNLIFGRHDERAFNRGAVLARPAIRTFANERLQEFDVRPPLPLARARQLSGGNQQKVIVAREFTRPGPLLIAAHPTRGIDLGAIEFIHKEIVRQRDAGRAVLLVSAELAELLTLSDRIAVLYEGRITFEARPRETDERELGLHMTGRRKADA